MTPRRSAFPPLAVAVVLLALAGYGAMAVRSLLDRWSVSIAARDALERWGLPATDEHLRLYEEAVQPRPPPFRGGRREVPVALPDWSNRVFGAGLFYRDLCSGGTLDIDVFVDPRLRLQALDRVLADAPAILGDRPVRVRELATADEVRGSLAAGDLVYLVNHSNYGRGFALPHGEDTRELVPFGATEVVIPREAVNRRDRVLEEQPDGMARVAVGSESGDVLAVGCRVLFLMGCRTEPYYRTMLRRRSPATRAVLTHYVWAAGTATPEMLDRLLRGLARGDPLDVILADLERGRALDILTGRCIEQAEYRLPPPYPATLLAPPDGM